MSFLNFFTREKKTANLAKERLQLILAHERNGNNAPNADFLPQMQKELLEVISRYIKIDIKDIQVSMDRKANLEVLEVKVELPEAT